MLQLVMISASKNKPKEAQIQFAAGAKSVLPIHESAFAYTSWAQARAHIAALPMEIMRTRVVSAHVMGGCGMGNDEHSSVVGGDGRHHQLANLYVFDGSVFPTSVAATSCQVLSAGFNQLGYGMFVAKSTSAPW